MVSRRPCRLICGENLTTLKTEGRGRRVRGRWRNRRNNTTGKKPSIGGARDYAASLNIARLDMAFLTTYHETSRYQSYRMTDELVMPALYPTFRSFTPREDRISHRAVLRAVK